MHAPYAGAARAMAETPATTVKLTPLLTAGPVDLCNGLCHVGTVPTASKTQRAAAQVHHATRYANAPLGGDFESKPAASRDGLALIDGEALRQTRAGSEQPSAEICARRSGARIFNHGAVLRKKEPRENVLPFACEHVCHRPRSVAAVHLQRACIRRCAFDGVERRERNDQLLASGVDPQRRRIGKITDIETEHRGKVNARCGWRAMFRRVGFERPDVALRLPRNDAGTQFERHRIAGIAKRTDNMSGAERWMAGKRHLESRRENAHVRGRALRRQNERRLGQIELQRECLHRGVVQPATVFEDAQRIAFERRLCEYVDDSIRVTVHPGSVTSTASSAARSRTSRASARKPANEISRTSAHVAST